MELRIDEKELKLLGLNMEIVRDLIIRIFGVSEVRFWIIPDQSFEEVLKKGSIKGAPAVLSTTSKDAQFNADVDEITEALLENTKGANNQQKDVVKQIVYNFRANFAKDGNELGLTNLVEHNINTSDNAPIKLPAYKTTPAKLAEIKKEVQQMLDLDIIQPSKSDWSAPVVLVGKKDGTSRFCVDFLKLNAITKKDAFPLPLIDQILDCLEGAQFCSFLDLAAGYWQVPLTESARPKTAFSTPDGGHYEYKRLHFGLCNAPATFQRLMNQLFKEEFYYFVTIFLDDVLIYSQNLEEHLRHLKIVMERLASAGLKLKPSKCKLIQTAVSYLGYHIGADGIWPDEGQLNALSKWPEPTNTTEVRSFVGFCSYYRRFVKDFAGIAKPYMSLLKSTSDSIGTRIVSVPLKI